MVLTDQMGHPVDKLKLTWTAGDLTKLNTASRKGISSPLLVTMRMLKYMYDAHSDEYRPPEVKAKSLNEYTEYVWLNVLYSLSPINYTE